MRQVFTAKIHHKDSKIYRRRLRTTARHQFGTPVCLGVLVVTFLLVTRPVRAETSGISGFSGIDNGKFCGNAGFSCHSTEDITREPTVRFEGPTRLDPGAVGTFRFVVESNAPETQIAAGLNVAASEGTFIVVAGQQTQLLDGEITHTGPKENDASGEAAWEFQWQAPTAPGTYVLFGAGNSVDFFGSPSGDLAAITTVMVSVGDVAPTPTPTPIPCAGDCNGNGSVAVNELIAAVNIALGSAAVETCPACDTNASGTVSVNELIAAVRRALNGC